MESVYAWINNNNIIAQEIIIIEVLHVRVFHYRGTYIIILAYNVMASLRTSRHTQGLKESYMHSVMEWC
jgi:hypothetical protein